MSGVESAAGDIASGISSRMPGSDAEEGSLSNFTAQTEALGTMPAEGIKQGVTDIDRASEQAAMTAIPSGDASGSGGTTI